MTETSIVDRLRGVRFAAGANRPLVLDDVSRVWFVERGHLDIFAVELRDREAVGRRRFVTRVLPGQLAFGSETVPMPEGSDVFGFLAVPAADTVVIEGERDGVASDTFDLTATSWIDDWIAGLSEFAVGGRPPPPEAALLEADPDVPYPAGTKLAAYHRDIIWVSSSAPVHFLGRADLAIPPGAPLLPITEQTWIETRAESGVSAFHTPTVLLTRRLWPALAGYGTTVLRIGLRSSAEAEVVLGERRRSAREARRASLSGALRRLSGVLSGATEETSDDGSAGGPLEMAAGLVAAAVGARLRLQHPTSRNRTVSEDPIERLQVLTRSSGIRTRRIHLTGSWWKRDGPPFVGFAAGEARPLAVIQKDGGGYVAVDPSRETRFAVDRRSSGDISREAVVFYAPLPDDLADWRSTLRFTFFRRGRDLRTIAAVGILGGLAALAVPVLLGQILAEFIPRSDTAAWMSALIALFGIALGNAVFMLVQGFAILRVEGRVDERLQSAIWSRLLALPAPFFRKFTAGDLADRANGVSRVRQYITGASLQAAVSGIFSLFSAGLLFYYSVELALYVSLMLALVSIVIGALAFAQMRRHREAFTLRGAINGLVFQMIRGLSKLRVAHAEGYALAHWARLYSEQKQATFQAQRWGAWQEAVISMTRPLILIPIFAFVQAAMLGSADEASFDLAAFLAFNTAFGQFLGATVSLAIAVTTVMSVFPLLERVRPILDAQPETAGHGVDPGDIRGDVEFANVSFGYGPDLPSALERISFRIDQGEYVAFVGPSGSGKSTIYRLLLAFERPDSGTVFLDGHDLAGLDPVAVRSRFGVVLQDSQLVAGSLYHNIAGLTPLSEEDAWAAVRAAALEDDIRAMPMGLHTVVPDGGSGLSVGQQQRLLIARALARRPRVLLFDEATSALDNRAQAVVQDALRKLTITRVVIAHRLSSIQNVDRIYVLDGGRIIESGGHDELMRQDGVFASLSRRQLVNA